MRHCAAPESPHSHELVVFPDGLWNLGLGDADRVDREPRRHGRQVQLQSRLQVLVDLVEQVDVHLGMDNRQSWVGSGFVA